MPEVERTHYDASGRMGYTAIDRFRGSKCQEFLTRFRSKKEAEIVAGHLNSAYQRGREEMMEELAVLFAQEGGQFYINQMLMAANGPSDPVIVTRMVTERIDVAPAPEPRDLRLDSLPYFQPDDEKEFKDSYRPGETLCRNHACAAKGTPHSHTERDIRSEVVPLPPLPHNPSLGCCAEHFNASPGNPVSP